jgi:plasmid maintenance system antidote protein VapI
MWLIQQMQYDLWQAEQKRETLKVERIKGSKSFH